MSDTFDRVQELTELLKREPNGRRQEPSLPVTWEQLRFRRDFKKLCGQIWDADRNITDREINALFTAEDPNDPEFFPKVQDRAAKYIPAAKAKLRAAREQAIVDARQAEMKAYEKQIREAENRRAKRRKGASG